MGKNRQGSRPLRARDLMPGKSSRAPPYNPLGRTCCFLLGHNGHDGSANASPDPLLLAPDPMSGFIAGHDGTWAATIKDSNPVRVPRTAGREEWGLFAPKPHIGCSQRPNARPYPAGYALRYLNNASISPCFIPFVPNKSGPDRFSSPVSEAAALMIGTATSLKTAESNFCAAADKCV